MGYIKYVTAVLLSFLFIFTGIFIIKNPAKIMEVFNILIVFFSLITGIINTTIYIHTSKKTNTIYYLTEAVISIILSYFIIYYSENLKTYIHIFWGIIITLKSVSVILFACEFKNILRNLLKALGIYGLFFAFLTLLSPKFIALYFGITSIFFGIIICIFLILYLLKKTKTIKL